MPSVILYYFCIFLFRARLKENEQANIVWSNLWRFRWMRPTTEVWIVLLCKNIPVPDNNVSFWLDAWLAVKNFPRVVQRQLLKTWIPLIVHTLHPSHPYLRLMAWIKRYNHWEKVKTNVMCIHSKKKKIE